MNFPETLFNHYTIYSEMSANSWTLNLKHSIKLKKSFFFFPIYESCDGLLQTQILKLKLPSKRLEDYIKHSIKF